jgi:two-component sensor histidine kinase
VAERVQARIPDTGELLPLEESPFHRALMGEPCVRELLVRNLQSGEDRIVRSAASPVISEGKVIGAVAINTDITTQKRYQLQLDDLNKRLKRGVQETHHRVKNNLQLVSSLLDIAIMDHPEALPVAEVKRLALQIRTLAGIHDVLTHNSQYSRDADAMTLSVQVMLSRLVSMLQTTAERHRIEQEIDDLQISLQKATALALITNELVSNAIKHGRGWARVSFLVEGEAARLIVEDDGAGFPADFTLETAAQTGLMLVDNLARHDLAGRIAWENRPEGGARVVVQLPLHL